MIITYFNRATRCIIWKVSPCKLPISKKVIPTPLSKPKQALAVNRILILPSNKGRLAKTLIPRRLANWQNSPNFDNSVLIWAIVFRAVVPIASATPFAFNVNSSFSFTRHWILDILESSWESWKPVTSSGRLKLDWIDLTFHFDNPGFKYVSPNISFTLSNIKECLKKVCHSHDNSSKVFSSWSK